MLVWPFRNSEVITRKGSRYRKGNEQRKYTLYFKYSLTIVQYAVINGDTDIVKILLDKNANFNHVK